MKMEIFFKRMRWKALAFLGKIKRSDKDNYGFKTAKYPSSIKELVPFENDMMDMINNLEFKSVKNEFQSKLTSDMRKIHESNNLFVSAENLETYTKSAKVVINEYCKKILQNIQKNVIPKQNKLLAS